MTMIFWAVIKGGYLMAIKKISEFPSGTPTSADKILFEQDGAGKSANISDLGINMDLLWTNASPQSSFLGQTISLDLSPYKLVLIKIQTRLGSNKYIEYISQIDGLEKHVCYPRTQLNLRGIIVKTNQIVISDNVFTNSYNGSDTTDNTTQIPYKIYGVK